MRKLLRALLWLGALIGALLFVMHMTFLDWWTIPGDDPQLSASIAPSLAAGDFVLMLRKDPNFGDLVRCINPDVPEKFVLGRVIGEAGDRIEIDGEEVLANDKRGVQEYPCRPAKIEVTDPTSNSPVELLCGVEAMGGLKHKRATGVQSHSHFKQKVTVGEGQLFLASDDRVFPMDSRNYGTVPKNTCRNIVFFRVESAQGLGDAEGRFSYIQ